MKNAAAPQPLDVGREIRNKRTAIIATVFTTPRITPVILLRKVTVTRQHFTLKLRELPR